ncbi:receptor-like protein kinase HERK 1 [Rutidosis leptorrhynchoides]|uniref:receptor-like protein kinase HERK 1 n=1 Tax=Rutidosis leptorrhynchoides TaxID=125765 RepID=UPI003A99C5D3
MAFMQEFQHLKIKLEDIKSATNNFSEENYIGGGGFGKVYKGEVCHYKGRSMAAFKRLDRKHGQGEAEFSKEIMTLSSYRHKNIISLLGYCNEDGEMILVYEYACNGSLDRHLNNAALTWRKRLKICLEAAKALEYLHDPKGTHQRVIHRDIKSGNILLCDNWVAKLADLGLSKMGPANQDQTFLISSAVGTLGYCDPMYIETGLLTKESDVYSFGVLLFEVLYGRSCFNTIAGSFGQLLVPTWKKNYVEKKIDGIHILQDMDPSSLKLFSDIAYRCVEEFREDRPKMAEVVTELEIALDISQEMSEGKTTDVIDYEEMVKTVVPPLNYRFKAELMIFLSKGVLLNGGTTWFSLNAKGQHIEMISIAHCMTVSYIKGFYTTEYNSR